jgi:hypothetical protein
MLEHGLGRRVVDHRLAAHGIQPVGAALQLAFDREPADEEGHELFREWGGRRVCARLAPRPECSMPRIGVDRHQGERSGEEDPAHAVHPSRLLDPLGARQTGRDHDLDYG